MTPITDPPMYVNQPLGLWPPADVEKLTESAPIEQPAEPKQLSLRELKKLRRQFVTVRHPVALCGHRVDLSREPRHEKCACCWFLFFNEHGELVQSVDELFQKHGPESIVAVRGKRFMQQFLIFMSAIAELKKRSALAALGGKEVA